MTIVIIAMWSIWLCILAFWIWVEKNTEEIWHEDVYPRDERGRIAGGRHRNYYHRLKNGRVVPFDIIGFPFFILLIANIIITLSTFAPF